MKLFRPSVLRQFLEEAGIFANKSLSQHFLIDGNVIGKILANALIAPGDWVLEIGPGPGALTQALLEAGAHVVAVEKDASFATHLHRLQTPDQRLHVLHADFLTLDLGPLFPKEAKVVANLPYQITTPILSRLLPLHSLFSTLTVMVQKEVADRMSAEKSTSNYSHLSLYIAYYATIKSSFTVPPTCFYPPPKVHSSVITLQLEVPPAVSSEENFFSVTRTAFHQRRKMLRASLKSLFPSGQITQALSSLGLSPEARPENLSLPEWISFYERVSDSGTDKSL